MKAMIEILKEKFLELFSRYCKNQNNLEELWKKIHDHYTSPGRYYHTLNHLDAVFSLISRYEQRLQNKDAVLLAVWFHDVVYNTSRDDNEEQSIEFMKTALHHFAIPKDLIQKAKELILLTKTHAVTEDAEFDVKLFLDADLSVLGNSFNEYKAYQVAIRKEYQQYPDTMYNQGRKKALMHFIQSEYIYKTEELRQELEDNARKNINWELKQVEV